MRVKAIIDYVSRGSKETQTDFLYRFSLGLISKDRKSGRHCVSIRWRGVGAWSRGIWIGSSVCGTLGNVSGRRFPPVERKEGHEADEAIEPRRLDSRLGRLPHPPYPLGDTVRDGPPYLAFHTRHGLLLGSPTDLGRPVPQTSLVQRQEEPEEG